jgi:hypothetical protein
MYPPQHNERFQERKIKKKNEECCEVRLSAGEISNGSQIAMASWIHWTLLASIEPAASINQRFAWKLVSATSRNKEGAATESGPWAMREFF